MERIESCIFPPLQLPLLFSLHLSLKVRFSDRHIYIPFKEQRRLYPRSMRIDEGWIGIVCFTFMKLGVPTRPPGRAGGRRLPGYASPRVFTVSVITTKSSVWQHSDAERSRVNNSNSSHSDEALNRAD